MYATALRINGTTPRVRNMTMKASGGTIFSIAVGLGGGGPTLSDVTLIATNGTVTAYGIDAANASITLNGFTIEASTGSGIAVGINTTVTPVNARDGRITSTVAGGDAYGINATFNSTLTVEDVIIRVAGGNCRGVVHRGASSSLTDVSIGTALCPGSNFGVYNDETFIPSTVKIESSIIAAATPLSTRSMYETYVGHSKLDGGPNVLIDGGTVTCAGVWDETPTFTAGPACP